MSERREFDGHVALVTGGAFNIGRAICLDLTESGAKVCVNAATSVEAAESLADEINEGGGDAMTEAVVGRLGELTLLINNASLRQIRKTLEMSLAGLALGHACHGGEFFSVQPSGNPASAKGQDGRYCYDGWGGGEPRCARSPPRSNRQRCVDRHGEVSR